MPVTEKQMANLKKIKPGEVKNPNGRPKNPLPHLLKQLSAEELAKVANVIIRGSADDLRAMIKDEKTPVLQIMVASVAMKIISKGDMHSLDVLLNRLVGKVKENIYVEGDFRSEVVHISPEQFKRLYDKFNREY